jgi:hypothetical protein
MDIELVVAAVVFFTTSWGLVVLCGRLDGRGRDARVQAPAGKLARSSQSELQAAECGFRPRDLQLGGE